MQCSLSIEAQSKQAFNLLSHKELLAYDLPLPLSQSNYDDSKIIFAHHIRHVIRDFIFLESLKTRKQRELSTWAHDLVLELYGSLPLDLRIDRERLPT